MTVINRREFLEALATLGIGSSIEPIFASSPRDVLQSVGSYGPGRIENEYSLFLPGEREALRTPPSVRSVLDGKLIANHDGQSLHMRTGDQLNGWWLLAIINIKNKATAVFEKTVTHRGTIVLVTESDGVIATILKQIGKWSNIRPRQTNTPHGVTFHRASQFEPDTPDRLAQYILNSNEDPCYENVGALGPEYIGWTLVANEEAGPRASLYLDGSGTSRQIAELAPVSDELTPMSAAVHRSGALWAPDEAGPVFDPINMSSAGQYAPQIYEYLPGYSKRTLLGGCLPVANVAVWNPTHGAGYEVMVLLPPGKDAKPIARLRHLVPKDFPALLQSDIDETKKDPDLTLFASLKGDLPSVITEDGQTYLQTYWNGSADEFYSALAEIWKRWDEFHKRGMQVEIPDTWLLEAAQAGLTLSRCSYRGLEPSYQIGEGEYTAFRRPADCATGKDCDEVAFSDALFPVAHYEFVWAHQLWNHINEADRYFQHYLDHYILPSGDFLYNTQDQVEAPLNIGVFLANSARSYFYGRDLPAFEKRLPILERMIRLAIDRYEYSKITFREGDRRRGLIWGSPEADLGSPRYDRPDDHPYYYQNAVWIWRGLHEHAKVLRQASEDSGRSDFAVSAEHYGAIAQEMRTLVESSIATTRSLSNAEMKAAGITPFRTDDTDRQVAHLTSYENHRFMEDWFLADWGDPALDLGHLKHRDLSGRRALGIPLSEPSQTSNFMAHGSLSVLIRQDDYRPFLLMLYALACYTADSGNRYSPEDAFIPGGHPLEGSSSGWSAVVNSTLQTTLGLRWLLCYEETDLDICHLQKAAPKHWFSEGMAISVKNCPTRFGMISWSTNAVAEREWEISIDIPKGFSADLVIHIHPDDGGPLRKTSRGILAPNKIILGRDSFRGDAESVTLRAS